MCLRHNIRKRIGQMLKVQWQEFDWLAQAVQFIVEFWAYFSNFWRVHKQKCIFLLLITIWDRATVSQSWSFSGSALSQAKGIPGQRWMKLSLSTKNYAKRAFIWHIYSTASILKYYYNVKHIQYKHTNSTNFLHNMYCTYLTANCFS